MLATRYIDSDNKSITLLLWPKMWPTKCLICSFFNTKFFHRNLFCFLCLISAVSSFVVSILKILHMPEAGWMQVVPNSVKKIHGNIASFMGSKSQTQLEREASIAIMTTIVVVVFTICNSFESLLFILHSQELLTGNYYSEPYSQFCSYFINFFLFLVFIKSYYVHLGDTGFFRL